MALLNPYLNFRGQAREALEFYSAALGGELTVSTFGDFGMEGVSADEKDSIMHGQLTTPAGFTLMGSDVPAAMPGDVHNGTVSLSGNETDELRGYWEKLAEGGEATALAARLDAVLARLACHGSIRAGRRLSQSEMDALLRRMEATPRAATCSHGRPTFLKLSRAEIEKLFGRR